MRSLLVLLALLWAAPAYAQEARWPSAEANRYWHLKQERIDAYRTQDRAYMERLLAPGFVGMGPDGRRRTRDAYLAAEFPPERREGPQVETEVSAFTAERTGPSLVLSYDEIERVDVSGQLIETQLARVDTYVLMSGRWRLLTMTAVLLPSAPQTIALSVEQLDQYVGVYEYGPGVTSTVRLIDGRLMEQSTGSPEVEMLPVGPDEFYSPPDLLSRAVFERDADGRIVAQIYRSGTQTLRARRVQ